MKYIEAYAKICLKHSEGDCEGCPFAYEVTGCASCLKYIANNIEDARKKIVTYVNTHRKDKEVERHEDLD